jgi:toxin-antitoxin system PIN domain toxin
VIAVDTNILVYAHRLESAHFEKATAVIQGLASTSEDWAIPWPCLHEFLSTVTKPRLAPNPTPLATAFRQVRNLLAIANLLTLTEGDDHINNLAAVSIEARATGGAIHDARIAAICIDHGVSELWTADRDFTRFPRLKIRNPLA